MYGTYWMYSLCGTQLDICNIYTSKFCTRQKFIQQQKKKIEERMCRRKKVQGNWRQEKSAQHAFSKHNVAICALCGFVRNRTKRNMSFDTPFSMLLLGSQNIWTLYIHACIHDISLPWSWGFFFLKKNSVFPLAVHVHRLRINSMAILTK